MEYTLRSSEDGKIDAPSMIEWAINACIFLTEVDRIVQVVAETWDIPNFVARALVLREVEYGTFYDQGRIDRVVFTYDPR